MTIQHAHIAIVTGGRDYELTKGDILWLDKMWERFGFRILLHGGALGADQGAATRARSLGLCAAECPALWKQGKQAGHERNRVMAWACTGIPAICLAFPGGPGTASMKKYAVLYGIPIFEAPT